MSWEVDAAAAAAAAEASELISAGHAANKRGDAAEARARFLQSGARSKSSVALISAANMALKLGDADMARAEYRALLDSDAAPFLSREQQALVQRKLIEVEQEARARQQGSPSSNGRQAQGRASTAGAFFGS